ncbi:MAG: hypothetical protein QME79_14635 [Bacillota bacterium]|nr:hypothetical protein [Bacillota bacterium]
MIMALSVHRKNDLALQVSLQDESGAALNITGAALTFVVRSLAAAVITKTTEPGGGITVTDAAAGKVEVTLTNADTDLPAGTYDYELLVTDSAGRRYTALEGPFTVLPSLHA